MTMMQGWQGTEDLSDDALQAVEDRTREIGRYVFDHLDKQRPYFLQRRWWDDRIMDLAMKDEAVKVQLFRFVDVLPMLGSSDAVVGHLNEFLSDVRDQLPRPLGAALGIARRTSLTRGAVARAAKLSAMDMARRFIAGTNTDEVVAAAQRERKLNRGFTLDILGEAVISHVEADRFCGAYVELIETIAPQVNRWAENAHIDQGVLGPLPRMNLSIKLSALDCKFDAVDPEGTLERVGAKLRRLLRIARNHQAFVNVDMESYDKKDLTLLIFKQILDEDEFCDVGDIGIVVQCYLRDAGRDLIDLADWARQRGKPVWVRLVKGAYWDYETIHAGAQRWPIPVYQQKWQSDACFERATRFVMQNVDHLRPALGTHNIRSMAHGIAVAEQLGLPQNAFEFQMLYGMADAEKRVLAELGHRLRVYMPYGELIPGMAYLVRRLLENTSNDSFLRAGFADNAATEELLTNPLTVGADSTRSPKEDTPEEELPKEYMPENDMTDQDISAKGSTTPLAATFANEPLVDFACPENRTSMRQALDQVKAQLGQTVPLLIGGESIETDEILESLDPSVTSRVVAKVATASVSQVADAVAAARGALPSWRDCGAIERARLIRAAAQRMRARFIELASSETYECGKSWREATADVCEAIDFCEYYAKGAIALEREAGADVPGEENRFEYRSRGVVGVIAPWNFPLAIVTGMTVAGLATGNTVVMKPAEQSPAVAAKLMDVFQEVGLPAGVLNYVPGRGEVAGAALVDHPDVALIAFTGSREVGLHINARAAEVSARGIGMVKRVIAEMGGKNAAIVDDDADLDEAVLGVVRSAFGFQGQKCSACSRAIVLETVYDMFVDRLVEASRSLQIGLAESPGTDVGPVIDQASLDKVHKYIDLGQQEGREVLAVDVPEQLVGTGYFVGPHIYADVESKARLAQEEVFGPVLAVVRVANLDEAIRVANATEYALTGGIFSRSPAAIERVKRELMVGNLYINRTITGAIVGRQPFGGFKMSGIGSKAGGPDYLLQYVIPRTITENTMRRGFAPAKDPLPNPLPDRLSDFC